MRTLAISVADIAQFCPKTPLQPRTESAISAALGGCESAVILNGGGLPTASSLFGQSPESSFAAVSWGVAKW